MLKQVFLINLAERYGQINYQGSGANASQIILMAFSKNSNSAETGRQYQSFDNALTHAKENNYGYDLRGICTRPLIIYLPISSITRYRNINAL
jgi:hypothetical protein